MCFLKKTTKTIGSLVVFWINLALSLTNEIQCTYLFFQLYTSLSLKKEKKKEKMQTTTMLLNMFIYSSNLIAVDQAVKLINGYFSWS